MPAGGVADEAPCPCGLGERYGACCGRLHRGEGRAATAEQLMRSRYSAFAVVDAAHLLRTWHPGTRPAHLELDPDLRWLRLDVLAVERGGFLDAEGVVEFRAVSRGPGGRGVLHERSRFTREEGRWVYLDGDVR
ncbi:YchJ family protein [Kineococcus glutinatus]|uniref:YchJ family protein n=1 Tax=Kineococcus glutinatus TaxID=1070872 RepID=UPI0031EAC6C6